jgi:membrane protease YdiL (CAAX protease family)
MIRAIATAAIISGSTALLLRPPATFAALAITGAAGVMGAVLALPRPPERTAVWRWAAASALGIAAFVLARVGTLAAPVMLTMAGVAAASVAAVAEELFFRRLMYGWVERWGPGAAIGLTAGIFAVVHLPGYGTASLPVNLAAGVLFGWQRWATGGWTAPALTHLVANLLQLR